MPSTGTHASNTWAGARGLPASVVLAGDPDKMIAAGVCFFSHASADWNGTISQYVPCSRKRRAISCVT